MEIFCRELAIYHGEIRLLTGPLFVPQSTTNGAENDKHFVHYEVTTLSIISVCCISSGAIYIHR